jgi:dihydroflavonol-4-reductase
MKTNTLITGSTGFVGANMVEAVTEKGWHAKALHRKSSSLKALIGLTYESVLGDILDIDSLMSATKNVDIVFHVAAIADYWREPIERMYKVNVEGTRNVLTAAKANGVKRVVFTSSVAALGQPAFMQKHDEHATFNLTQMQFPYGHSKVLAEQIVADFIAQGLDVVIVNPAVVMGPRDVNLGGGEMVIRMAKSGIPVYPSGGVCVVDVGDVCAGQISAALQGRAGERYILGGENLWYQDLLNQIADVTGRSHPKIKLGKTTLSVFAKILDVISHRLNKTLPISGDQLRYSAETFWFDSSKAKTELGIKPRPFIESAKRTYDWFKVNGYLR